MCGDAPPTPEANKGLLNSADVSVKEFDYATYACETGKFLTNSADVVDGKFRVRCPAGTTYPATADVTWPTCKPSK